MKYLDARLYNKLCSTGGDEYQREWDSRHDQYISELKKFDTCLPKRFLAEYYKTELHDNIIFSINLRMERLKLRCKYILDIELIDYHDKMIHHKLSFKDIDKFSSNICISSFSGYCDWLYSEILQVDHSKLSMEILLFDDSVLSFEFRKMSYKKITKKD